MPHNRVLKNSLLGSVCALLGSLWGTVALAQPTQLLRVGDVPTSLPTDNFVRRIQSVFANQADGYAAALLFGASNTPHGEEPAAVWGAFNGVDPNGLTILKDSPPIRPAIFDRIMGLSNSGYVLGSALLAPDVDLTPTPSSGFIDSLWLNESAVAIEGQVGTGSGLYWGPIRRAGMTADGRAYWLADLCDRPFDPPVRTALFLENGDDTPIAGGSAVGGSALAVRQVDGIADFAVSPTAARMAAIVHLGEESSALTSALLVNGAIWNAGGRPVATGGLLPAPASAPAEHWLRLDRVAISEGEASRAAVMCAAETDRLGDDRYVLLRNSSILLRSGSTVSGETLRGPAQFIACNAAGDYAVVWGIRDGTGQALIVDGAIVLKTGDAVRVDGLIESQIVGLKAPSGIALGTRTGPSQVSSYVVASVLVLGEYTVDVLYRIDTPTSTASLCLADWNQNGTLDVSDLFAFQVDYFAGHGDFDGDGQTLIQDLFAYLSAWFLGC